MRASRLVTIIASLAVMASAAPASAEQNQGPGTYTIEQAISDNAQLNTIA